MRQGALAGLLVAMMVAGATANGRPPATSTIHFRQGHEADVVAGMTFGVVISHDSGATWHWMCEDAVGYGGTWDPDYAYTSSGAIFATTFRGLVVNRTGCTFDATAEGAKFISTEELGPTGALHIGAADPADAKIYRSDDDGVTFPTSTDPGMLRDWWQTMVVAPSDPNRLYVAGYRFVPIPGIDAGTEREYVIARSVTKGATFEALSMTGITTSLYSILEIAAVSPTNPDVVFLRVTFTNGTIGDAIYRSTNGGDSWTKVLEKQDSLRAFAVRANGDVVAGTPSLGAVVSHDCQPDGPCTTWVPVPGAPHLGCLVENAAGEMWGCTQNYGGDGYGIMKTTDLATWTPVLKFQDIKAPVACPTGSVQKDQCEAKTWCGTRAQLGITADPTNCPLPVTGDVSGPHSAGCCDTGGAGPGAVMLGMVSGIVLLRRRRYPAAR